MIRIRKSQATSNGRSTKMTAAEAARLIEAAVSNDGYKTATNVLNDLSVKLQANALFCMTRADIRDKFVKKIAEASPDTLMGIINSFHRGLTGNFEKAYLAYLLVKNLPRDLREDIMAKLMAKNWIIYTFINQHFNMETKIAVLKRSKGREVVFPSGTNALEKLTDNKFPPVIAIGEYHARELKPGIPTTAERFAGEYVTFLFNKGVRGFILEKLPYDISQSEIRYYLKHGKTSKKETPMLWCFNELRKHNYRPPFVETFVILDAIRRLKETRDIKVYGCFDSFLTIKKACVDKKGTGVLDLKTHLNAAKITNDLLQTGYRVAIFSGASRNDIIPELQGVSIATELEKLGVKLSNYMEVDMVVPEYVNVKRMGQSERYYKYVKSYVPEKGVVAFQKVHKNGGRSVVIVYARTKDVNSLCSLPSTKAANGISETRLKYIFDAALHELSSNKS